MIFDEHQLRAIHLIHNKTKEEADLNHENHWLRDKLVSLFDRIDNRNVAKMD